MTFFIPFQLVARILAVVFALLFVILAFFPATYAPTYGVAADEGVMFITQRAAPMFILPMVALWGASSSARSGLRDAVALGTALTCVGIAVSGVVAWVGGIASPVILVAAVLECVMAAALMVSYKN